VSTRASDLPEEAYAVALASLPDVGPGTLRTWLDGDAPSAVWCREGSGPETEVARRWELHVRLGISVLLTGHPGYPARLLEDPEPPAVLFGLGETSALGSAPTVAIVGTRSPTRYGLGVAAQLGTELAVAGVSVVSGLALGIDGAAHEGACAADGAPPIGVVAGGLDKPYPPANQRLWKRVAERGAVMSESPAGVGTEKWRFPVRNRLMAALSDVVVVVESRHGGGARYTVEAALARSIPVGAVPGSIRSAASEDTNALLGVGAFPVCGTADLLVALSLRGKTVPLRASNSRRSEPSDLGEDQGVYDALSQDPASLDDLLHRTKLRLTDLCAGLQRLAQAGLARDLGGWWVRT
jgi:DNA processing protein